jgi:thiol-disulfide isomerase/thioredoxin
MSRAMARPATRWAALAMAVVVTVVGCASTDAGTLDGDPADASSAPTPQASGQATPGPSVAGVRPCPSSDASIPTVEDGLPDLTLPCLTAGPAVRLAGLRGTPIVMNVWASWCPPCRDELPLLVDLDRRTDDADLLILGLDLLDRTDPAIAVLEDFGVRYPSVADPDGDARAALSVQAPPVTFFIDEDGVVVARKVGPFTSQDDLDTTVESAFGIRP